MNQLTVYDKQDGVALYNAESIDAGDFQVVSRNRYDTTDSELVFSRDSQLMSFWRDESLVVVHNPVNDDSKDELVIDGINKAGAKVEFSPTGRFLVTWEKPEKGTDNSEPPHNLRVWLVYDDEGGALLEQSEMHFSFFKKRLGKSWPLVRWSDDGFLATRCIGNAVLFYDGRDFSSGALTRFRQDGVFSVHFGKVPSNPARMRRSYLFVTATAGRKGQPSKACLYSYPTFDVISAKSWFDLDEVSVEWSYNGQRALVEASTQVVQGSYYGAAKLYMMGRNGDGFHVAGTGQESKETVNDAQWSPVADEFVVIEGRQARLYDVRGDVIHNFGDGPWNTIKWSPHGVFILLGGFANMAGDFRIFHRESLQEIGFGSAHGAKTFEWLADGRRFMTASLFPWRRVDNDLKIFSYSGQLLQQFDYEEIYQVHIHQSPDNVYEAPELDDNEVRKLASNRAKESKSKSENVFVPAALRGKSGVKKLHEKNKGRTPNRHPTNNNGSESKPKKKRKPRRKNKNKGQQDRQQVQEEKLGEEPIAEPEVVQLSPEEVTKKIRNIRKKLKQINGLKSRRDQGEALEQAQIDKMNREGQLLANLEELEGM